MEIANRVFPQAALSRSINDLPYDILRGIFIQCLLPDTPQPNTTLAPLLLCHICSTWRSVALGIVSLWTHLHFEVHMEWYKPDVCFVTRTPTLLARDVEILRWWRRNHRAVAPYLHFTMQHDEPMTADEAEELSRDKLYNVADDDMNFILEYVTSAQYLHADDLYMCLMQTTPEDEPLEYPNMRTLRTEYEEVALTDEQVNYLTWGVYYQENLMPILAQDPPVLRRLELSYAGLSQSDPTMFTNWSILTHLNLHKLVDVYTSTWFPFLRCLTSLRCFAFSVTEPLTIDHVGSVTKTVLPCLSTLIISIVMSEPPNPDDDDDSVASNPIITLLEKVHMPVLRELTLYLDSGWPREQIPTGLYPILELAPNVTTLAVGPYVVQDLDDPNLEANNHPPQVDPISKHAVNLKHLCLIWEPWALYDFENLNDFAACLARFVDHVSFAADNRWLDLSSRHNTIGKMMIDIHNATFRELDDVGDEGSVLAEQRRFLVAGIVSRLTVESALKYAQKAPKVTFDMIQDGGLGEDKVELWFAPVLGA